MAWHPGVRAFSKGLVARLVPNALRIEHIATARLSPTNSEERNRAAFPELVPNSLRPTGMRP